jgi:hypothetical protein
VDLVVSALWNGVTQTSPSAVITITAITYTLTGVSMTPTTDSVTVGGTVGPFWASPTCTPSCPAGITYAWTMNPSGLGSLNATTGPSVTFTATNSGTVKLYVNATLGTTVKMGGPSTVVISAGVSPLTSVTMSPTSPSMNTGNSLVFTAIPTCTDTCPDGVSYAWTVSNALGTISPANEASTTFTAGGSAGTSVLTVTATLQGHSVSTSTTITINTANNNQQSGAGGLSTTDWILIVVAVVVVVCIVGFLALRPKKKTPPPEMPKEAPQPSKPAEWKE